MKTTRKRRSQKETKQIQLRKNNTRWELMSQEVKLMKETKDKWNPTMKASLMSNPAKFLQTMKIAQICLQLSLIHPKYLSMRRKIKLTVLEFTWPELRILLVPMPS